MKINSKIKKVCLFNNKKAVTVIVALIGAWIVSIPYEGQVLKTLALEQGFKNGMQFEISLIILTIGLLAGSLLLKNIKRAKLFLNYTIPICFLSIATFFINSYLVWIVSLSVLSFLAGVSITATSYYLKKYIPSEDRYKFVPLLMIFIKVLDMISVNLTKYISIYTGTIFLILILVLAWILSMKISVLDKYNKNDKAYEIYNKKKGYRALFLLVLFLIITGINYGIMVESMNPQFFYLGWLQDAYVYIPYIITAFIILKLRNRYDRSFLMYITISMILAGFILYIVLDYSVPSYLIIYTLMMSAWAIVDVFWWTILIAMLDMNKDSAKILGAGFSATMIGAFIGRTISQAWEGFLNSNLSIVAMAVICLTLIVLPLLHKYLSLMVNRKERNMPLYNLDGFIEELPKGFDTLSEREKQVALLLIGGRTYKQISDELIISINTVKTHIKNIYSILGIKNKSQLYNMYVKEKNNEPLL